MINSSATTLHQREKQKEKIHTIVCYGIKNLNHSLKFHWIFARWKITKRKKGEKIHVRVGRLFVANINLSFAGEKIRFSRETARTNDQIRSTYRCRGRCFAMNFRTRFETWTDVASLSGPIYQPVDPFRGALSASELTFE